MLFLHNCTIIIAEHSFPLSRKKEAWPILILQSHMAPMQPSFQSASPPCSIHYSSPGCCAALYLYIIDLAKKQEEAPVSKLHYASHGMLVNISEF